MTKAQREKRKKIIAGYVKFGFGPKEIYNLMQQFHPTLVVSEQRIGQIMKEVQV